MEVKRFTGEEMDTLRSNPYTYKVTQCQISFTTEFKELFWKYYNKGMTPRDILPSLGYAGEILMNEPSAIFEIIHSLTSQPESRLSVSEMCRTAGVSRSGYYAWVKATPMREAQEEQDRKDFDIILEAYQ